MPPSASSVDRRRGFTLIELVVAMLLFCLLGGLAVRGCLTVAASARRLAVTTDELWARRALRWVLRDELAGGVPGVDWTVHVPDSVRLRAFRSTALPCAVETDGIVVVRDGGRRPDPAKDSVLVLAASGSWRAVALEAVGLGACPPGAPHTPPAPGSVVERWSLDAPAPDAVLLRVFERGSYHLADGVLRYRRGAGGRQPLTAEALSGARLEESAGALRAVVPERTGPPLELRLAAPTPPPP